MKDENEVDEQRLDAVRRTIEGEGRRWSMHEPCFYRRRLPFVSLSRINWKSSISPRLKPPQLFLWFKVAIDQRTFPRGRLRKPETSSLRAAASASCPLPARSAFFLSMESRNFNQLGRLNLRAPNSRPYFHVRNRCSFFFFFLLCLETKEKWIKDLRWRVIDEYVMGY